MMVQQYNLNIVNLTNESKQNITQEIKFNPRPFTSYGKEMNMIDEAEHTNKL